MDIALGPGIEHAQRGLVGDELCGRAALEDATGEAAQAFCGAGVVAAPGVIDDANARAFPSGVPHVFGNLEVAQYGAVGALLVGLTQIHMCNDTCPM